MAETKSIIRNNAELNYEQIGKQLIDKIAGKPYGSIPKKELDLLLLSILYNNGYYTGKSNYEMSLELMISEARLDNLIYDLKLRGQFKQDVSADDLSMVISSFSFNKENGRFLISIPDKFTKNAIIANLESKGIIYDFSFNNKLLSLDTRQYALLLEIFLSKNEKEEILKLAKKQGFETSNLQDILFNVLGVVVEKASEGAVSGLMGPISITENIVSIIKDFSSFVTKFWK